MTALPNQDDHSTALPAMQPDHPCILATASTWRELGDNRREDPALDRFLLKLEGEARALLTIAPSIYQKLGRRMLAVSREVLRRVLLLGLAYHTTGEAALARRAEEEMLAAAAFDDWNPIHFLDVAEMMTALAIGYDWLYDQLALASRNSIKTAIVEKGLHPALQGLGTLHFYTRTNNWNQVCLGGMALGALVVREDKPELAQKVFDLVTQYNPYGLEPYAPVGIYPEGPLYWAYGTTYQILLLEALEQALGTDLGLSQSPGFLQTADCYLQTTTPPGKYFDFSDSRENAELEPAVYWFADRLNRPELLHFETPRLEKYVTGQSGPVMSRFLPLIALWWPKVSDVSGVEAAHAPLPLRWFGAGPNSLVVFRTSWKDPNAMYLGLKGGAANLSHAHMDAGSFIFEWDGIRWAQDLGWQPYYSLESKGISVFGRAQDSQRWTVFRLNNFSHNTLTINGQMHCVTGGAKITSFSNDERASLAIVDMSDVFAGQVTRVQRGFVFRPNSHVLIQDELEGLKQEDHVRWAMVTGADVTVEGCRALLQQDGRQIQVYLHAPDDAHFEVIDAAPPENDYDAPNPGKRMLIVSAQAPESGSLE